MDFMVRERPLFFTETALHDESAVLKIDNRTKEHDSKLEQELANISPFLYLHPYDVKYGLLVLTFVLYTCYGRVRFLWGCLLRELLGGMNK